MSKAGKKMLRGVNEARRIARGDVAAIRKIKVTPSCGCVLCDLKVDLDTRGFHHDKKGHFIACTRPRSEPVPQPEGRKDDGGKDPWHLVPWDAMRGIVAVLRFGAGKYAPRNWERGMAWSRPFSALIRHLAAWWEGEKADPETGFSHLWHAGCCIVFLIAYELRGVGQDDRPINNKEEK